ncbi:MAG TPA: protein kinase [Dehalococcoidia bacterium]|nr:protein kinase [Dehalococcoidia bacterium]
MPSERIQRQIDALLDQAEAAVGSRDWDTVRELCDTVLRLDHENADARTYLDAAEHDSGVLTPSSDASGSAPPPSPTPQPDTPSSFAGGRYEVREFLGEGGKKRVFLAHDSLLDRDVAFALVRTDGLDDAGRERITREAQAMGRLGDHPHIVPVLDLGQETNIDGVSQPYIVSQYMAGGSVEDLLAADDDLPLERTLEIALGVCRG